MSYDADNIFAKIISGDIPSVKVYEDEHAIAIMDVMPQADGHVLVIPRAPSRNLLDADPAMLGPLMAAVQKVARAVATAFDADGININQFNEPAAGQTVFHLHVHVIPRHDGVSLRRHSGEMAPSDVLENHAEMIRAALA